MSEEGYKPTPEEIQKAEDSMSERQEKFTDKRQMMMELVQRFGVSEKAVIESVVETHSTDPDAHIIKIKGHVISYKKNVPIVFIDDRQVYGKEESSKLYQLSEALIRFHSSDETQSSEVEALLYKNNFTEDQYDHLVKTQGYAGRRGDMAQELNEKAINEIFS